MKITTHIGLPKTGTTSLQGYLAQGYSAAPRDGVWYPDLGLKPRDPSHSWLGNLLREGDVSGLAEILVGLSQQSQHVILSDENIFVETPGIPKHIRDQVARIMAPYDVHLLSVTRHKTRWKRSFYIQSVELRRSQKQFSNQTANHMWQTPLKMKEFFEGDYATQLLDRPKLTDEIAQMFAAKSVVELSYDKNPDILETVKPALGLSWDCPPESQRRNPSLSDVQAEVLRQANGQNQIDGRMIRSLIYQENGLDIRPRIIERIRDWAPQYGWDSLQYTPNPPLHYSKPEFQTLVDKLRVHAERHCAAAPRP